MMSDTPKMKSLRANQRLMKSESTIQLQCDEIQGKLTTFISSLQTVQEKILQSDKEPAALQNEVIQVERRGKPRRVDSRSKKPPRAPNMLQIIGFTSRK